MKRAAVALLVGVITLLLGLLHSWPFALSMCGISSILTVTIYDLIEEHINGE